MLDSLIARSPDAELTARRIEQMRSEPELNRRIERLPQERLAELITVIGISAFLFRFLCSHGNCLDDFQQPPEHAFKPEGNHDFASLRRYKYRELLRLTRLDLAIADAQYPHVLTGLTRLAEQTLKTSLSILNNDSDPLPLCILGLGKLGAAELNFSSDIDLIFVMANRESISGDLHDYQKDVMNRIRHLSRNLEEQTPEGFLYRVDLKLRPWGRSGPLAMSVDETEQYYEGSSESWERFAWLRARVVAGTDTLGQDLLTRMQPFIFMRSLAAADLDRFVQIKSDMADHRHRTGSWNVKVGEGGIRDIEFFVQMLQIVNGSTHAELRTTNTLTTLQGLVATGLLDAEDADEIRSSYLFLRRLENRLQMIDERQAHDLPEDISQRRLVARSLGFKGDGDEPLQAFEAALKEHRQRASNCYERILPDSDA